MPRRLLRVAESPAAAPAHPLGEQARPRQQAKGTIASHYRAMTWGRHARAARRARATRLSRALRQGWRRAQRECRRDAARQHCFCHVARQPPLPSSDRPKDRPVLAHCPPLCASGAPPCDLPAPGTGERNGTHHRGLPRRLSTVKLRARLIFLVRCHIATMTAFAAPLQGGGSMRAASLWLSLWLGL